MFLGKKEQTQLYIMPMMEDMATQLCYEWLLTAYIEGLKAEQEVRASKTMRKMHKKLYGNERYKNKNSMKSQLFLSD